MSQRRLKVLTGALFAACGISGALGVHLHPERVNGPAWLGHVASAGFLLTGLAIVCQEAGYKKAFEWLILGMLISLAAIGGWIAFGPGARVCGIALPGFGSSLGGWACRSAFGLGASVVGAMALWQLVRILRGRSAA